MDIPDATHSHDEMQWLQTPREYLERVTEASVVVVAASVVVIEASGMVWVSTSALNMLLEKWSLSTSVLSPSDSLSTTSSSSTASSSELLSLNLSRLSVDSCDTCRLFVISVVLGNSGGEKLD